MDASCGERNRLVRFFQGLPIDRVPFYFFGTWPETKVRWAREGCQEAMTAAPINAGPTLPGMDADWEMGPDGRGQLWNAYGIMYPGASSAQPERVIDETPETVTVVNALGAEIMRSKVTDCIPLTLRPALLPTRADWERFRRFLDPDDPLRWPADWRARARTLQARGTMNAFLAGSLYGMLRDWMGVESISCLMYDDPELFQDMVDTMADFYLAVNLRMLSEVSFEIAYFFEDCCFNTGALFSPSMYRDFFEAPYRRMIAAYRAAGIPLMMMDSDGMVEDLLEGWLDVGFDIIFPIEVGAWKADPWTLHQRFGTRLHMFGGFDKHLIPQGEVAIRRELERLRPLVEKRVLLPIPDHRIPPDCSWPAFQKYIAIYQEVFAGVR